MSRKIAFVLLLACALVLAALPAGAHVARHRDNGDEISGHLGDALYSIEKAESLEYDFETLLKSIGPLAGFGAGGLYDSVDHLKAAADAVAAAGIAGEIGPSAAADLKKSLDDAMQGDAGALNALAKGAFKDAPASIAAAEKAKEEAEDLIYGYPDTPDGVDLGCKLYLQSNPLPGDTTVGLDGCQVPLSGIEIAGGYHINRFSSVTIGSNQYPCDSRTWQIFCNDPVPAGQEVFISFDTSAEKTANDIIAKAADGRVQVIPFTIGSLQPTTDTGAVAKLFWATSRGFKPAVKLEQGSRYAYNLEVTNEGPGAAFDGKLQVTVPPTFAVEYVSKGCSPSGTTVICPLDNIRPYEGISPSIVGRPTKPGPLTFNWAVTTTAKQPTPDKTPNSGSTKVVVYPVPLVKIKKISRSIKLGGPGTISGIAGSDVKKVQLGILQKTVNPAKVCKWLGPGGKLVVVAPYAGACDKGVWLDVKGALKWEFKVKLGLPPGSYYVLGRGTSTDGITGTLFKMSDWSLDQFKVK